MFFISFFSSVLFKSIPNDKILDMSKWKGFADNSKYDSKIESFFGKGRKHCGEKGEYAGYQHFLLFQQCFQKASYLGLLKSGLCGKEINL